MLLSSAGGSKEILLKDTSFQKNKLWEQIVEMVMKHFISVSKLYTYKIVKMGHQEQAFGTEAKTPVSHI